MSGYVDCGECPRVNTGCPAGQCMRSAARKAEVFESFGPALADPAVRTFAANLANELAIETDCQMRLLACGLEVQSRDRFVVLRDVDRRRPESAVMLAPDLALALAHLLVVNARRVMNATGGASPSNQADQADNDERG